MNREALWRLLDALTDAVVPALDEAEKLGITVTQEDREALSDWLQDRFNTRASELLD